MGLKMKYFVLKPHGDSLNAIASRMAMVAYAESISSCDKEFAQSLLSWVDREQAQSQQGESGNCTAQSGSTNTTQAEILLSRITRCLDDINFGALRGLKIDLERYRAQLSAVR